MKTALCFLAGLFFLTGCVSKSLSPADAVRQRAQVVRDCYGTYSAPPRLPNKRVDILRLLAELEDLRANTYHWLIRPAQDWEDLKAFLPLARQKKLQVWVTLLPPSEPPVSQPFGLDFPRWAEELAKLSLAEPNLVAWSIDDFLHNQKLFTPEYVAQMVAVARQINPRLAFVPCCYFKQVTPKFVANHRASLDGILFPYRAESVGANLQDAAQVENEVKRLRDVLGADCPIILDVYATAHSRLGASTPNYVEQVIMGGKRSCDGVLIYCHQDPQRNAEKYEVIKRQFDQRKR